MKFLSKQRKRKMDTKAWNKRKNQRDIRNIQKKVLIKHRALRYLNYQITKKVKI